MDKLPAITLTKKPGHKASVISSCVFTEIGTDEKLPDIFFTNSEDGTIRMWDLRSKGAVKLFRAPSFSQDSEEMSNLACSHARSQLYTCHMNNVG